MSKSKITIILFFLFIFDRISKGIALKNKIAFFNNDFGFGLPSGNFSTIISILIFLCLFIYIIRKRKEILINSFLLWISGLMLVGGISNIIDRVVFGGVIDFINIAIFPSFNFADIYISIGVLMAMFKYLLN